MDLVMPVVDGVTATHQITELGLAVKVIALTSFSDDDQVFPAIQAGAASYLLKDVTPDALVDTIRAVHRGENRLHPDITRKLMRQVAEKPGPMGNPAVESLTGREQEVLALVARGFSNQKIAETLVISEKTVKSHVSSLLGKLGLGDRTQLAIYAFKSGLARAD
jgi:two-component system, NarL family, response regulator LiaR